MTAATAVALGGCLALTAMLVHAVSFGHSDETYSVVGLCGELIATLGLVSYLTHAILHMM